MSFNDLRDVWTLFLRGAILSFEFLRGERACSVVNTSAIRESADFHGSRFERRELDRFPHLLQNTWRLKEFTITQTCVCCLHDFTEHYEILELRFGSRSVGNQLEGNDKKQQVCTTYINANVCMYVHHVHARVHECTSLMARLKSDWLNWSNNTCVLFC